jgi:hypothetical protein
MVMEIANSEYAFACRIDNVKEAAMGNRVISGCAVTANAPADMFVDVGSGYVRITNAYKTISAVSNQAITAAHATLDRYDTITVGNDGTVDYTAGTAAANPMPPDLPASHILLATIFVEHSSTTVETADIADNRIIYADSGVQVPIGGIIPWAKTITGTPTLPTGWMECDGSTVSDAESPINGQAVPNLNSTQRFLRGASTSGGTGGADTVAHTHAVSGTTGSNAGQQNYVSAGTTSAGIHTHTFSATSGAASDEQNMPAYYQVVFIIRIK